MKKIVVKCPYCKKDVKWNAQNQQKPFCSERCKLLDLGKWASDGHVIKD